MSTILRRVFAACMLLLPITLVAQTTSPRVNVDYTIIATPQPVYAPIKGKIEVAEVFSYACGACASANPTVGAWHKTKAADINFVYIHSVVQGGPWERFARGFYAAEAKKIQPRSHDAVFQAVFVDETLSHSASLEDIAKFYSKFGISSAQMLAIMNSPSINAKLNRSKQFSLRTGANTTPTIIVAGKYKVNATREGGFPGMMRTVDFLVAKERAALAARAPGKPATPVVAPAVKK
ncbi:MAG: thiol:disulfide interchange protein DsbA/DsbL [Arenimonas sp.]